jgi:hypothetical protein
MTAENWTLLKDVVLFGIAIYGAVQSTFNWRQALRRDTRHVTMTASSLMPTYGGQLGAPFAKLEAVNTGQRAVTIKTMAFQLPNRSRIFPMERNLFPMMADTDLPATLTDGQSYHLIIPYAEIANGLLHKGYTKKIKLTPVGVDSADNVYEGEPWDVDPHKFMRMGA